MKICVAQIRPLKGDVEKNIENHKKFAETAASNGAEMIIFPELSLTGYEPQLAKSLATGQDDERFGDFQIISDAKQMIIGVGMPTKSDAGILISMLIFQPRKPRQIYSKQFLHSDETPYFVGGNRQILLTVNGDTVAPAICYESLLPEHSEQVFKNGANIYVASVAKSNGGIKKASKHFPQIAAKYSMPVLMANCVGHCDDFESVGKTAVWNKKGALLRQLDDTNEELLIFDTDTEEIIEKTM